MQTLLQWTTICFHAKCPIFLMIRFHILIVSCICIGDKLTYVLPYKKKEKWIKLKKGIRLLRFSNKI